METPYTYVFVRTDIPTEAQIVQAGHACLEAGFMFDAPEDGKTCHMVLLGIDDEERLIATAGHLDREGIGHKMFFEPDFDMGHSAIATEPVYGEDRSKLKKYKLLKHA